MNHVEGASSILAISLLVTALLTIALLSEYFCFIILDEVVVRALEEGEGESLEKSLEKELI